MLSFSKKRSDYLHNFILKSSIKLLIPLFVTTCLYQGLLFILGDFCIENKTLNFLGSLSFEIYLTHGIFEDLLHASFDSFLR